MTSPSLRRLDLRGSPGGQPAAVSRKSSMDSLDSPIVGPPSRPGTTVVFTRNQREVVNEKIFRLSALARGNPAVEAEVESLRALFFPGASSRILPPLTQSSFRQTGAAATTPDADRLDGRESVESFGRRGVGFMSLRRASDVDTFLGADSPVGGIHSGPRPPVGLPPSPAARRPGSVVSLALSDGMDPVQRIKADELFFRTEAHEEEKADWDRLKQEEKMSRLLLECKDEEANQRHLISEGYPIVERLVRRRIELEIGVMEAGAPFSEAQVFRLIGRSKAAKEACVQDLIIEHTSSNGEALMRKNLAAMEEEERLRMQPWSAQQAQASSAAEAALTAPAQPLETDGAAAE